MPENAKYDNLCAYEVGRQNYENFVKERIVGPLSIWEKMSKVNLLSWKAANKTSTIKLLSQVIELKQDIQYMHHRRAALYISSHQTLMCLAY